jgi:hypothetical protein
MKELAGNDVMGGGGASSIGAGSDISGDSDVGVWTLSSTSKH